jgi:uncharacterized Zn finger protein (UPF0148 family)
MPPRPRVAGDPCPTCRTTLIESDGWLRCTQCGTGGEAGEWPPVVTRGTGGGRRRKVDPAEVVTLAQAGKSTAEIAQELGSHPSGIRRILVEAGWRYVERWEAPGESSRSVRVDAETLARWDAVRTRLGLGDSEFVSMLLRPILNVGPGASGGGAGGSVSMASSSGGRGAGGSG